MKKVIILIGLLWMALFPLIYGQQDTSRFRVMLKANQQFATKIANDLATYKTEAINGFINAKEKYTNVQVSLVARKKIKSQLTLNAYYNGLTPESKNWFKQFYNNTKASNRPNFDEFLSLNGEKSILAIGEALKQSMEKKIPNGTILDTSLFVPASTSTSTPSFVSHNNDLALSNLDGSKLILEANFGTELRYIISDPLQSIFLRGMRAPITSPYFPYYYNEYCDACCGPAAGQSILEWFNVPVYGGHGELLTTTHQIQRRLANLMETTDGIDYTHPDDLCNTLIRDEFAGDKGYCYEDGDASFLQLEYMLSEGTPVILLIAKDDWAHYITVYGYNNLSNTFDCANFQNGTVSYDDLDDLWSFASTDWTADVAYTATGVFSNTLFSYCPEGCDHTWEYNVNIGNFFSQLQDPYSRSSKYYNVFNSTYVDGRNESGSPLNFYGMYSISFPNFDLLTYVNSSGIFLYLGNDEKIISLPSSTTNSIANMSLGTPINAKVYVNKQFLDTYPEVYCGFDIKDANNNTVWSDYKAFANYGLFVTPGDDQSCYEFDLSQPFNSSFAKIEFNIHSGFRKITWNLSGCTDDMDQDYICDEVDLDVDGDGVQNDIDNCPVNSNPSQIDHDNNGKGLECDAHEKCLIDCDSQYYNLAGSGQTTCTIKCGRHIDPRIPYDILEGIVELQFWEELPDLNNPKFEKSKGYKSLKRSISQSLNSVDIDVNDEQIEQIITEIYKVKKDIHN